MRAVGIINASWTRQTFALSRCNDPRSHLPKKPRNRRTKEEWKTMAETFIKKYQNSNNGNFPSVNLTHKNVGGSFYTVREVFRQVVIQETKGLGPFNNLNDECAEESSHCIDNLSNLSLSVNTHSIEEEEEEEEEEEDRNLQEISASLNQVISVSSSHGYLYEDLQRDDTSHTTQREVVDAEMNSEENVKLWKGDNSLEVFEAGRLRVGSEQASIGCDEKSKRFHISHDLHEVQAVDTKREWEEAKHKQQQRNMGDGNKSIPLLDGMSRKHLKEALKKDRASESNPIAIVASAMNGFFASFVEFFTGFKVK